MKKHYFNILSLFVASLLLFNQSCSGTQKGTSTSKSALVSDGFTGMNPGMDNPKHTNMDTIKRMNSDTTYLMNLDSSKYMNVESSTRMNRENAPYMNRDTVKRTDRDTVKRADRDTSRRMSRDTSRRMDRDTSRHMDRDTSRRMDRDTSRRMGRDTSRRMSRDTSRRMDRDTSRRMDRDSSRRMDRDSSRRMDRDSSRRMDRDSSRRIGRDSSNKNWDNSKNKNWNSSNSMNRDSLNKNWDNSNTMNRDSSIKNWDNSKNKNWNSSNHMNPDSSMMSAMNTSLDKMHHMEMSSDVDHDFAQMMMMHHQAAIEMSELVITKGKDARVKKMAQNTITAHKAEITQMEQFLKNHKVTVGETNLQLDEQMNSMMKKMNSIKMTGNPDQDYVMMMIPHQEYAVSLAEAELKHGKDMKLKNMAQNMISAQKKVMVEFNSWKSVQK